MATKIRLQRGGTTNRPFYRFIVTPETSPRDCKFIEKVGTYDPLAPKDSPDRIKIKKDRIEYWLSVGAVPTERVAVIINKLGLANDNTVIKKILKKRARTIELKKVEVEAKKKLEAETAAKEAADKASAEKAEADKQAAEAVATASAIIADEPAAS